MAQMKIGDVIPEVSQLDALSTTTLAMIIVEEAVKKARAEERERIAKFLGDLGEHYDPVAERIRSNNLRPRRRGETL